MSEVPTVKGPVSVDALGPTLMHEHVFVFSTEHVENYGPGSFWDEDERIADAVSKLSALRAKGITTIADPTVLGLGRSIPRIQAIASQVDLNIIVATGMYTYGDLPFAYTNLGPGTMLGGPEPLVADFVRDLTEGIADTGVKAAFLKCAVEHAPMTPGVERSLRAVGQAHIETGAPMTVHTSPRESTAPIVVEVLQGMGADLTKLVIGHAGDSNDLDSLMALADTGAILGMDRFGIEMFNATADRVATVAALAERGYADRMVLSHDASCYIDWFGPDPESLQRAVMPSWNYEHISDNVLPMLREAGVREADIDAMLVGNPRRYFTTG